MNFRKQRALQVWLISIALSPCLLPASTAAQEPAKPVWGDADREKWLADFHQLLDEMSSHYANLEWAVSDRHMDLPTLRVQTEKLIREAQDAEQEHRIFQKFLDAFGDGHVSISWQSNGEPERANSSAAAPLCDRLGYASHNRAGVNFSLLPGFQLVEDADANLFPGGVLHMLNGPVYGVIRIASFGEHSFPQACEEAVKQIQLSGADRESCKPHSNCEHRVENAAANTLLRALERRIDALRKAGAQRMIVDITDNGGGSNWVEPVVRTLSPVPLNDRCVSFIKHPHWTQELEERLKDIQEDLQRKDAPKEVLTAVAKTLQESIILSKESCDRSSVWTSGNFSCTLLVSGKFYFSGMLPYTKPGSFPGMSSRSILFHSLDYDYHEGVNSLPLLVLINAHTWSSAEYFASILQGNKAAKILGQLTGGAGCGYTNGGIPTVLKNSGAHVKLPDCVRWTADGTNENAGVTPDVWVPWANRDSPYQQARKLELVLQSLK
jgi:hypothetical protein